MSNKQVLVRTRPCVLCHKDTTLALDAESVLRWQQGAHVQTVWPEMSAPDREVLISGTHPACWEEMFAGQREA